MNFPDKSNRINKCSKKMEEEGGDGRAKRQPWEKRTD
jgi:hypothetical protein